MLWWSDVACVRRVRSLLIIYRIHCEIVRELWSSILNLFGVEWVMLRRVIDLLGSWGRQVGHGIVLEV
jgi:hypothetical protein